MREFQERRRIKKLLHSRYAIAFLIIVAIFVARGVWGVYQKYEKSKEIAQRMLNEAAALQTREDSLKGSIAALSTPEGKEKEIRDRFGVVKPGEKMVVLVDNQATTGPILAVPSDSWWSRFLSLFGL